MVIQYSIAKARVRVGLQRVGLRVLNLRYGGFPKVWGTVLGVPIIRIIVY